VNTLLANTAPAVFIPLGCEVQGADSSIFCYDSGVARAVTAQSV
jgi:hypothetical protein